MIAHNACAGYVTALTVRHMQMSGFGVFGLSSAALNDICTYRLPCALTGVNTGAATSQSEGLPKFCDRRDRPKPTDYKIVPGRNIAQPL